MKLLAIVFLSIAMCGCASLRQDESLPAAQSGYDTAEWYFNPDLCTKDRLGMVFCHIKEGDDLAQLQVAVQGYFGGTVKWESEDCAGVTDVYDYEGNPKLPLIALSGPAKNSCLISVLVSPKYSRKLRKDLKVYSFRGHLAVKVTHGEKWVGDTRRVTGAWNYYFRTPVQGGTTARVILNGCGSGYNEEVPIVQENNEFYISVPIHSIANDLPKDAPCIMDGFYVTDEGEEATLNIMLHYYNTDFNPLPKPVLQETEDGKLKVKADRNVSVIALNNEYDVNDESTFTFSKTQYNVLRLLTVKGRSVLCEWRQRDKYWDCQN